MGGLSQCMAATAWLRRNANLIKEMREQLKPYQSSSTKHAVWERF